MIVGFLEWGRVWRERKVDLPPEQPCPILSSPDCHLARKGSWASPPFILHSYTGSWAQGSSKFKSLYQRSS